MYGPTWASSRSRKKTVNRAINTHSLQFRDAFWAAACEVLEEGALLAVEARATQLLEGHRAAQHPA